MFILLAATWSFLLLWSSVKCASPNLNVPACSSQFNSKWSFNSEGQSPCLLAGYLGSVCSSDNSFKINAITPPNQYLLTSDLQSNCTCSSVYYSALSACASCQGATYLTWKEWTTPNCSTVYTIYPNPVPAGTAIPHWAFQSFSSDNSSTFNVTLAQLAGDLPESTAPSSPTNTESSTSAATSSSGTSDNGKSEAGAIAGGVVGGLAFICIAAILAVLFLRYRRRKRSHAQEVTIEDDTPMTTPTPFVIHPPDPPMRLYNPSDPSTFPTAQNTFRIQSPESPPPPSHYRALSDSTANYSGVAEI